MKTSESKSKIVAVLFTTLFFASIFGLMMMHDTNTSLEELLQGSKLKSESLLSEKLAVEKEVNDLKFQIVSQLGKNAEMDRLLNKAKADLARKEKQIQQQGRNANNTKELADLRRMKSKLEQDLAGLKSTIMDLQSENLALAGELNQTKAKNKELTGTIGIMEAMAINNYQISATNKNEKLTVVARRAKSLNMAFDFPQSVASGVKFKIHTPDGKLVDERNEALSYNISDDGGDLTASIEPIFIADMKVSKRIEMKYKPKEKLKKGVYTIDIYNGESYISSCQVRLK